MRLFVPRVGAVSSSSAFRFAAIALLALALGCSRKHPLPGEIPRFDCEVTPSSLEFGTVAMGDAAERSFTVTNHGSDSLSGSISESCPDFQLVGGAGFQLAPGGEATFRLSFQPAVAGRRSCTLDVGPACSTLPVAGDGQAPGAACDVSPASLDFGTVDVGQSADRTFIVRNTGASTLSGSVVESCPEFSIVDSAAYNLTPGQSDTFTVRFAPASGGSKICTIETGASACGDLTAGGTGRTVSLPACQVSAATLEFGGVLVGQVADLSFTITNGGGGRLAGFVAESCAEFAVRGSQGYDLGAGASKTFTVRFAPLTPGPKNCTIDTGGDCADIAASGRGDLPAASCSLSTTNHQFGAITVGSTAEGELVITNVGGGTLSGTLSESCGGFAILGNPTYGLGPLESARFTITFAPAAAGEYECALDAGSNCGTVTLRGTGVAP